MLLVGMLNFILAWQLTPMFHFQMALLSALRQIAGVSAGPLSDALKAELYTLVLGTISLPINLPGTNYYQGFKVS